MRIEGNEDTVAICSIPPGRCFYRFGKLCVRMRSGASWPRGNWYMDLLTGDPSFCSDDYAQVRLERDAKVVVG